MQWRWTQLGQLLKGSSAADSSLSAGKTVGSPQKKLRDVMALVGSSPPSAFLRPL